MPLPRGAYVLIPERDMLVVAPNDVIDSPEDRWLALFDVANFYYDKAGHASRVSRQNFRFNPYDWFRVTPWPQDWVLRYGND